MTSNTPRLIDEQESLTHQLELANLKIKQLKEEQIEIFSRMSHELNTPLNIIIGYANLLKSTPLNDDQIDDLTQILTTAQFLHKQTSTLLRLAELKSHDLTLTDVAVCDLLTKGIGLVENSAQKKSLHINLCLPSNSLTVTTNQACFEQVLVNLLINAIHYSPEGETIFIGAEEIDRKVRITVADNGQGIPDEYYHDVFSLFHDRDISHVEGMELGLFLAKEYIDLLGGTIDFKSEEQHGASFWVDLPLCQAE